MILCLFPLFSSGLLKDNLAQPTPSQAQRSQEILENEEALRQRIEKEESKFVKQIILKGSTYLNEDEIKEIISPFQKKWLSKKDIQQILDLIKQRYQRKDYPLDSLNLTYEINRETLKINIEELRR